jgi:hypothetical protein
MEENLRPPSGAATQGDPMPVKFRMTGCWMSILFSVILTVLLNLMLRGCNTL